MSRLSELIFGGEPHKITSPYGPRGGGFHYGTDYGTHLRQLAQFAVEEGEVYSAGYEAGGAGHYVWVKYPRLGKRFLHCHLAAASPLKQGDRVQRGTLLGYTGSSGNSTGIHLHLGVRDLETNAYEDPELFAKRYTEPVLPQPLSPQPVRLKLGFASPGDMARIEAELSRLRIPFTVADGIARTEIAVSAGDQRTLLQLCGGMGVPCAATAAGEQDAEADGADGAADAALSGEEAADTGKNEGVGEAPSAEAADAPETETAEESRVPDGGKEEEESGEGDVEEDADMSREPGGEPSAAARTARLARRAAQQASALAAMQRELQCAAGELGALGEQLAAGQAELAKADALALELDRQGERQRQQVSALLQHMEAAAAALAGRSREGGEEWQ